MSDFQQTHFSPRFQPLPDIAKVLLAHLALFFTARLALCYFLYPLIIQKAHVAKALYIGLKFDARYAVLLTLPITLSLLVPVLERRISVPGPSAFRKGLCLLQSLLFTCAVLVYALDFGFFFYLQERLAMTVLDFVEDPLISVMMIWESYPVIPITIALGLLITLYYTLLNYFLKRHMATPVSRSRGSDNTSALSVTPLWRGAITVISLCMLFLLTYGQMSSNLFPLRWSNAYFSGDKNISLLALNPMQNLWDTRHAGRVIPPDMDGVRAAYPHMAEWLRVPEAQRDTQSLNFIRHHEAKPLPEGRTARPNIVIIIMESLAWPRTSFAPAPSPESGKKDLNPTPFLRKLADKSLYFDHFFAPSRTTARAVFTTISGVPDVNHSGGTTSRNPILVDQASVFNEFKEYEKYYMLGGSASWANIRGLLQYNIDGLNLLEEGAWQSPNVDVWGISDLALFREAVEVFNKSDAPFISFIQTAAFHRPYTIPDDNDGYVRPPKPDQKDLLYYGFESEEEYVSLHFSDYALSRFFEYAKSQPWYDNTVFAIFGDHGLTYVSENVSPGYLGCQLQAWHTPLLLYSPGGLIEPGVAEYPAMQPDVLVTMASLAGIEFTNGTMGRDLLNPNTRKDAVAFISSADNLHFFVKDGYTFGLVPNPVLYRLDAMQWKDLTEEEPERAAMMQRESLDFANTSKYMLFHNAKRPQ